MAKATAKGSAKSKSSARRAPKPVPKVAVRPALRRPAAPLPAGYAVLGEVRRFAFGYAPAGWAPCNGALVAIAENMPLFSLLGTTYGGDGYTNFGLPKIASPDKDGLHACVALDGIYPSRP